MRANLGRHGLKRRILFAVSCLALAHTLVGARPALAADDKPIKIRLQTVGANASTIPDLYARVFHLYEKAGIDPEFLPPIYNANAAMQMLVQGSADVTYSGGSSIIQAVQQGRRVKVIATVMEGLEQKISLTKSGMDKIAKLGVTPGSDIKDRVSAMRGFRLAAPATGSSSDLVLRYSLKRYGIDANKDLVIQPMSDLTTIMAAVRQGVVDGVAGTAATANARAEAEGVATRYIAFEEDDPLLRAYPTYVLATSDEFLSKNPESVRRLLTVFSNAKRAIRRGLTPEEIAAIKKEFFPDMTDAALAYGLGISLPLLEAPLEPKQMSFDALITTNNAVADVPASIKYDQAFAPALASEVDSQ